jgi:hypothetical protein
MRAMPARLTKDAAPWDVRPDDVADAAALGDIS